MQENTYFTRAGDFTTDLDGAIVTQSGANVMGWKANADGNIIKDRVQALYATSPEYTYTAPAATTGVTITGNVDSRETGDIAYTVNFYDSLGNEYQATLNLTYDSKRCSSWNNKLQCCWRFGYNEWTAYRTFSFM